MDIVHDPNTPSVGRQDQIVIARMNLNIENRNGWQAVLHPLPGSAPVESHEESELGTREQQIRIDRILADHMHGTRIFLVGSRW